MKTKRKLFISLTFFSCLLMYLNACITPRKGPEKAYANAAHIKPFDAIIVPGVPFIDGRWDTVMKARVLWSYILYKNGYARNIIYSGASVYSPYKEALIMGLYAQQLGIPKEHIYYDTDARHSTENVYYSYLLAQKEGFKSLALATDPVQSFLLRGFTKKRFETPIYHLPYISDSLKPYAHLDPLIDPASAHVADFIPITKQQSFFKRWYGTLGKDIPWENYKNGKVPAL